MSLHARVVSCSESADRSRGPESREIVRGFPTVVEYARRIHDRYFPDYEAFEK